jgi:hypothetical protein
VLITIEDTGPGVESKDIERIFEPFYTTRSDGTGMGLSICRSIVHEHGGRLFATPSRSCGLAMQISLPASTAESLEGRCGRVRSSPADKEPFIPLVWLFPSPQDAVGHVNSSSAQWLIVGILALHAVLCRSYGSRRRCAAARRSQPCRWELITYDPGIELHLGT